MINYNLYKSIKKIKGMGLVIVINTDKGRPYVHSSFRLDNTKISYGYYNVKNSKVLDGGGWGS